MKKWLLTVMAIFVLICAFPRETLAVTRHENITGREALKDAPLVIDKVVYKTRVDREALSYYKESLYYRINLPSNTASYVTYKAAWVSSGTSEGKARISIGSAENGRYFGSFGQYIGNMERYNESYSLDGFIRYSAGQEIYLCLSEIGGSGEITFTLTIYSDTANNASEVDQEDCKRPGDSIEGTCPRDDDDWYRFKTGDNNIYHAFLQGSIMNNATSLYVYAQICDQNGNSVSFPSPSGGKSGIAIRPNEHHYIPLEPNTEYLIHIHGQRAAYNLTIEGFSLEDVAGKTPPDGVAYIISSIYYPGTTNILDVCEFTGKAIFPDVKWSIYPHSHSYFAQPVQGVDYDISYRNNDTPGTATITITGKGLIRGSFDLTFEIQGVKAGTVLKSGKVSYTVTENSTGTKTVSYTKSDSSKSTVTIPNTVTLDGVSYKITSVDANAFKNNKKLVKVTIGSNVTSIGKEAFSRCTKLTTVKGCENVTTVGDKAFYGCTKLKQVGKKTNVVTLSKVKTIGKSAFYNCKAIKKINLTSTALTKIGNSAFSGCTSMTSFSESSVKLASIGSKAFYKDSKLASVTLKTSKLTKSNVGSNAFKGIKSNCKIKVPSKKVKSYKSVFGARGAGKKVKIMK